MPGEAPTASTLAGRLRPLSGLEEELVHADREGNAVALCNELLARCLARPGRDPGRARAEVDALLVSERDLALVALRQRSLGSELAMELTCPACGADHDLVIDLTRLGAPPPAPREIEVVHGDHRVRVRLPTARDPAVAAAAGALDAGRATLLAATLLELDGRPGPFTVADAAAIDPELREAIDAAVEDALPDVDLALVTTCSTCDAGIEAPVYLAEVILAELRERGRQLLREVHLLARTYHWSERQILSLSVARRRAYLTLIEADHDAALVLAGAGDA